MEKPSTKKPMNVLKTMVFLKNFMKNIKKILKAWKDYNFLSTLASLRELEEDEEEKYYQAKQTLEKYFDELNRGLNL